MKRKLGWRLAGLTQSYGAVHDEIPAAWGDDPRHVHRGRTSPSRKERPSNPPKLARKSVERLLRTGSTSIPPEIDSQDRQPVLGAPIFNFSPALTVPAWPAGSILDPMRTSKSPPHHATTRSFSKRNCKSPRVISSPAAPSSLPTIRFATRNPKGSSAPPDETPNSRKPVRPTSCTDVTKPARSTITLITLSSC